MSDILIYRVQRRTEEKCEIDRVCAEKFLTNSCCTSHGYMFVSHLAGSGLCREYFLNERYGDRK